MDISNQLVTSLNLLVIKYCTFGTMLPSPKLDSKYLNPVEWTGEWVRISNDSIYSVTLQITGNPHWPLIPQLLNVTELVNAFSTDLNEYRLNVYLGRQNGYQNRDYVHWFPSRQSLNRVNLESSCYNKTALKSVINIESERSLQLLQSNPTWIFKSFVPYYYPPNSIQLFVSPLWDYFSLCLHTIVNCIQFKHIVSVLFVAFDIYNKSMI